MKNQNRKKGKNFMSVKTKNLEKGDWVFKYLTINTGNGKESVWSLVKREAKVTPNNSPLKNQSIKPYIFGTQKRRRSWKH